MSEPDEMALADLPEEVRARVVVLTSDVLPAVPRVPASLRKVADFAPARRARLGATAIASALEVDPDFRGRVAVQLGEGEQSTDDVETAARAWLHRPEDWQERVAAALSRLAERPAVDHAAAAEAERWQRKALTAEEGLREARARHRDEVADLKAENTKLRRRLGEARKELKEAVAAAEEGRFAAAESVRLAEAAGSAQDREVRQLRSQVERLEAEAQAARRSDRADRDEATIRARLLLETVIDAATGLRRELSLPSIAGAPADRLESALPTEGIRGPRSPGALGPATPAQLEQLLAMPKARLIVDGYNVSKAAWASSPLEAQRIRLLAGLGPLVARTGAETTVVFDAANSTARPVVNTPRGVKVRFSPEGVIADDVIRDLVAAEPTGRVVVVVSSDQAVARDVTRDGARVLGAEALVGLLRGSVS